MTAKHWKWVWLILTVVWAILLVPSILWWKDSLLWVIIMSWGANVAASAAAYLSARADQHGEERDSGNG